MCLCTSVNGLVGIDDSEVFALVDDRTNTTRAQALTRTCPCATCIRLLHPAPTSAHDGLDPLQLFLSSTSTNTSLALNLWSSPATCTFLCQLAHLLMYTNTYGWASQVALCNDGGGGIVCCIKYTYTYVPSFHRKCCYNTAVNH